MTPSLAPSDCSTSLHEARKRLPMEMHYESPVDWPEAGLQLWRCKHCCSHVAVALPALDEDQYPTQLKEAV